MNVKTGGGRNSLDWVVIAKGIGIILVVIGHFEPDNSPAYWSGMRTVIYTFHMPLFFFLSGYLYVHGKYSYVELVRNKIERLIYPFIVIAAAFLLIKYIAGIVVHVDYPVSMTSVLALISNPVNSYAPLLWFIHALFIIFVVYPLARSFMSDLAILVTLLAVNEVFGSRFPYVGNALNFAPFFCAGVLVRQGGEAAAREIAGGWTYLIACVVIFAAGCQLELSGDLPLEFGYAFRFFLGVMGAFAVINLSAVIARLQSGRVRVALMQIGLFSMTIYLFHSLFESAARVAFQQLKNLHAPFLLVAAVAIAAGVAAPMLLEREFLRRFHFTRKFVLGMA